MSVLINASTSTGLVQSADTSGEIELQSNGTTALKVNTNEGIQILNCLGVGNATPSTSGAGITFPASQSASTDANTLDDYEEGTFTPTAYGGTSAGTTTYANQTGYYTKIGRQVTIVMFVSWTAMTGTGDLRIGSLPFTSAALGQNYSIGTVLADKLNWSGGTSLVSIQYDNTNYLLITYIGDDIDAASTQVVNETASLRITITYFV
jgi:hypothetical protein